MDLVNGSTKSQVKYYSHEGYDPVAITCRDYFIQAHKGINYYLIDLKTADWSRISTIIEACDAVEKACWTPQEDFFNYLGKCDILSYAEKDGRIIAFDVVTLLNSGSCCVYSNDETMVLKECRGMDIARKLVIITLEWFFTRTTCFRGSEVDYIIFTSISANPRVVNSYFKHAWSRIFFDCSFKPSPQLVTVKEAYCRKHRISLVDEHYPFCFKNLFPGSNKFDPNDPKHRFSRDVFAHMPHNFDHMGRGDAFAFMLKIPMGMARVVVLLLMLMCFGKAYLSRKGMGLLGRKKQTDPQGSKRWSKRMIPELKTLHIARVREIHTQNDPSCPSCPEKRR